MSTKTLEHMTLDELSAEGRRLQEEMATLAERTQHVYDLLYKRARREPGFLSPAYLNLSNGGKRFAGMVSMGLKRAKSFDRILENSKRDLADQEYDAKEKQARKEAKAAKVKKTLAPDPYTDLFGPDNGPQPGVELAGLMAEPTDINDVFGEEV